LRLNDLRATARLQVVYDGNVGEIGRKLDGKWPSPRQDGAPSTIKPMHRYPDGQRHMVSNTIHGLPWNRPRKA